MRKMVAILAVLILAMSGAAFAKGGYSGNGSGQGPEHQSQQQGQGDGHSGKGHVGNDSGDGVPNDWGGCK